ncbi:hypothetical protein CKA32_001538 [Geitlerinema sp. FC II]|nr:hypothetical protein CKA32_001538 [Geitlerinema sp. FC II]
MADPSTPPRFASGSIRVAVQFAIECWDFHAKKSQVSAVCCPSFRSRSILIE